MGFAKAIAIGLVLLVAGCATGKPGVAPLPLDDAGLNPGARLIVEQALVGAPWPEICGKTDEGVSPAVRQATVKLMFGGKIADPRRDGTEAGHFLSDQCRQRKDG